MKRISLITVAAIALTLGTVVTGLTQQQAAPAKAQYGGIARVIVDYSPRVMSYVPLMGPLDHFTVGPAGERLVTTTGERQTTSGIEPVLAEKIEEDAKNLRITWHIRKDVTFHDGSSLDAEAVRWNFQLVLDAKVLPYARYFKGMRIVDRYTLVMDLTEYSNQLVPTWGWWPIITSEAAWEKASGGDLQKGIEWARSHIVGTGPFMLKEYKRDAHITWVKNPNYWRKGKPYLDGIENLIIADPTVALAMMLAKEADGWAPPPKEQADMMKKGFKRRSFGTALVVTIFPNTAYPGSKWKDKRLREALEYALDKDALARVLGFGLFQPLNSLPPPGEWGYDPTYNPRPYNPEKARQLLAAAGYASGLRAKLLITTRPAARDAGTAIKQYLDAAGFQIDLDVADPGRFTATVFNTPPGPDRDLAILWTFMETNYLMTYMRSFGTEPFTDYAFLGHTPEQAEMDRQAQKVTGITEQQAVTRKLMRYITDNALVIPIYDVPGGFMVQPWMHDTYKDQGVNRWQHEEAWMEKH
jgi:peptide/nickel transport system substrate-binding protein